MTSAALRHALTDPGEPPLRPLPDQVTELLVRLDAAPRLAAHLRAVHDVAWRLTQALAAQFPSLTFDQDAVLFGAATHDIGKTVHTGELSGPGSAHEQAGYELLLRLGIEENLARFARTHASWHLPDIGMDDLLVSVADKVWKGKRVTDLEQLVVDRIAAVTGRRPWQAFMDSTTSSAGSPPTPTTGSPSRQATPSSDDRLLDATWVTGGGRPSRERGSGAFLVTPFRRREDRAVLIEVVDVVLVPAGAMVVCRSSLGQALVVWKGMQPPVRGHHHVEWTVDAELGWGRNAVAALRAAPGIRMEGQVVVLCGRLRAQQDDMGFLELGGTSVLLDLAGPVPLEAWDSWIELRARSSEVEVYPYDL